jgi:hypothetical protein
VRGIIVESGGGRVGSAAVQSWTCAISMKSEILPGGTYTLDYTAILPSRRPLEIRFVAGACFVATFIILDISVWSLLYLKHLVWRLL